MKNRKRHPVKARALPAASGAASDYEEGMPFAVWLDLRGAKIRKDWEKQLETVNHFFMSAMRVHDYPMYVGATAARLTQGRVEIAPGRVLKTGSGKRIPALRRVSDKRLLPVDLLFQIVGLAGCGEFRDFYVREAAPETPPAETPSDADFERACMYAVYSLDPEAARVLSEVREEVLSAPPATVH